jgi:sigma-E factor negative regulatory protein RseA
MERISALMDGELDRQQVGAVLPDFNRRDELREAWATYHLIGEAMRGQPCLDSRVAVAVASRLAAEPTVLAPRAGASNFGRRWAWPSLAAAAAVASVTWMATGIQGPATAPSGSFQPAAVVLGWPPSVMTNAVATFTEIVPTTPAGLSASSSPTPSIQLSTEAYQPYLMAHQPFSPSMSIQGLAPYMRTVGAGAAER